MKKLFCVVFLLMVITLSIPVCAESAFSVSSDTAKSALESSLENGFASYKNIQIMLDNALLNGFDYYDVKYSESSNSFWIEVAVDGLASALESLENSKSEDAKRSLIQAKEAVISHCQSIIDLLKLFGRQDIGFILEIVDDGFLADFGTTDMNLVICRAVDGEARILYSRIKAWNETE